MYAVPAALLSLLLALLPGCIGGPSEPLEPAEAASEASSREAGRPTPEVLANDSRENLSAPAPPPRVLYHEVFSGSWPEPAMDVDANAGGVGKEWPIEVPRGAGLIHLSYNATFTGPWPAWVHLYRDGATVEGASNTDSCGFSPLSSPQVAGDYACSFGIHPGFGQGAWTVFLESVPGATILEEYSIEVTVFSS